MGKQKLLFILLLTLLPIIAWAQQNYDGQHVSIKQTTGDSIQYDLSTSDIFRPIIKDGKTEWLFQSGNRDFSINNAESINFRSFEYDERETRKALIEFYKIMDGDNWQRNDNWCSDKPIWEWYGVNGCLDREGYKYPWVDELWFNCAPISRPVSGKLPDCISRMGPIKQLALPVSNLEGELPAFLGNIYSLRTIVLSGNYFTGQFPSELENLPYLDTFVFEGNDVEGPLPESFILSCMDKEFFPGNNFNIARNKFTGKVPQSIQKHPRFADFWPGIVIQKGTLDVSDLVIPAPDFTTKDVYGNELSLPDIYKKNKYTLLYKWGLWCPFSEAFNQKLVPAYKAYKDKGLEVIGIHYDLNYDDGLLEYMKDHDIPWNNAIGKDWSKMENNGTAIFQWAGTPQVFLVDPNGNIVFSSLMDEKGNCKFGTTYRDELFTFLEEKLGPVEYNYYTSTDYSRDGEVSILQTATVGQGIDLVFVGEAFTDKDIEDGVFDQSMNDALEQFFKFEPYASLRNRFNVYAVKAVSPNSEFADGCTHAINTDYEKALEYAAKVPNLIPNRPMRVTVVYKHSSGGRSFCTMMEDNSYVAFAMESITNVLNHESGGHGIGRLFDEYVEQGNEGLSLPDEEKTDLDNIWTTTGWGANVDWRSDPTEVKWAKFISDSRYADEKIGVYQGSYLYGLGAYRPTENSMMRYNDTPFNAPSREEIYKRVMKESEGDGWNYDYETFVEFDAPGRSQFIEALTNASRRAPEAVKKQQVRTAPPVFVKGTWRDALKNQKK